MTKKKQFIPKYKILLVRLDGSISIHFVSFVADLIKVKIGVFLVPAKLAGFQKIKGVPTFRELAVDSE